MGTYRKKGKNRDASLNYLAKCLRPGILFGDGRDLLVLGRKGQRSLLISARFYKKMITKHLKYSKLAVVGSGNCLAFGKKEGGLGK